MSAITAQQTASLRDFVRAMDLPAASRVVRDRLLEAQPGSSLRCSLTGPGPAISLQRTAAALADYAMQSSTEGTPTQSALQELSMLQKGSQDLGSAAQSLQGPLQSVRSIMSTSKLYSRNSKPVPVGNRRLT